MFTVLELLQVVNLTATIVLSIINIVKTMSYDGPNRPDANVNGSASKPSSVSKPSETVVKAGSNNKEVRDPNLPEGLNF